MQVYFAAINGQVKAGVSRDIPARLRQLSRETGCQVGLIGAIKGGLDLERKIHKAMAPHRINGEWYHDCPETRAVIQNCFNNFDLGEATRARDSKFGSVCRAIWPTKTAEHLAAAAGCSMRSAAYQLSGEHAPSAKSIAVIVCEIARL